MAISSYTGGFYNLNIKPDLVADTVAEVEIDLASYFGKYIEIVETGRIHHVDMNQHGYFLEDAYADVNYTHTTPNDAVQEVFVDDGSGLPVIDYPAIGFELVDVGLYQMKVNVS